MSFVTINTIISWLGLGLVVYAYIPQIRHLITAHCSAGISRRAYVLWFVAAILLLIHSIMIHDLVFIVLQALVSTLTGVIWLFAERYKHHSCPAHHAGTAQI